MLRTVSLTLLLVSAVLVGLSSGAAAAGARHHRHGYYVPYAVNGPCQTFHYQVVQIRNNRVTRAYLQPQAYCGLPHEADPSDISNGSSGSLTEAR
jgi:hypothetical protein